MKDVDFVIETEMQLLLVEYKNPCISGASNPDAFNPEKEEIFITLVRKFYDSLHYLLLKNKIKPIQYICVLEYPRSNKTIRNRLRNKLKWQLPFELQEAMHPSRLPTVDKVAILTIDEWNSDPIYKNFPIRLLQDDERKEWLEEKKQKEEGRRKKEERKKKKEEARRKKKREIE